jgi:lipoate-protein ligase A
MDEVGNVWRLIEEVEGDGAWNMAVDEAIFNMFPILKMPTLRLYTWSPPAVSIGRLQRACKINLEECERRGIDLIRRPTGGRAVLHQNELTYSFVHSALWSEGICKTHRVISEALAEGLKKLGLSPILSPKKTFEKTPACFESPSYAELTIEGKKVIGSAQTRNKKAFLEHGSIPLSIDYEALRITLGLNNEAIGRLKQRACGLGEFGSFTLDEIKSAITEGFADRFGVKFKKGTLTSEELMLAKDLLAKYRGREWNFRL